MGSRVTSNRSAGGTFALIHHHGFTCPFGVCLDGRGASRGRDRGCNLQRSYWRDLHRGSHYHRGCGHLWWHVATDLGRFCSCQELKKAWKCTVWKHTKQVGRWTRVLQEPCSVHEKTGSSELQSREPGSHALGEGVQLKVRFHKAPELREAWLGGPPSPRGASGLRLCLLNLLTCNIEN